MSVRVVAGSRCAAMRLLAVLTRCVMGAGRMLRMSFTKRELEKIVADRIRAVR